MKTRNTFLGIICVLLIAAGASAYDTIYKVDGTTKSGKIKRMSPTAVTIEVNRIDTDIPQNEVKWIRFDDEPTGLTAARRFVFDDNFEDAVTELDKIELADDDPVVIHQDVAFYRAYVKGKLALGGSGTVTDAGTAMAGFVAKYPSSYHIYEASEMVGDLLVAMNRAASAEPYYMRLAQTPWDDYKMRAGVAIGRLKLAQGQFDDAIKQFNVVLGLQVEGKTADRMRLKANLGRAVCGAAKGQVDTALVEINKIIGSASAEDMEIQAQAYNARGNALLKAGKHKEALLAFLHVDVLYAGNPEAHAEALFNLSRLWKTAKKDERAAKAAEALRLYYRNSIWAQRL